MMAAPSPSFVCDQTSIGPVERFSPLVLYNEQKNAACHARAFRGDTTAMNRVAASAIIGAVEEHLAHNGAALDGDSAPLYAAALWYAHSAARGNVEALFNLGSLYKGGLGVAPNRDIALQCFEDAARKGHVPSMYHAGEMLMAHRSPMADEAARAIAHWERAASMGHARAQHNYAVLLWTGVPGVLAQNGARALVFGLSSAAQDVPPAAQWLQHVDMTYMDSE